MGWCINDILWGEYTVIWKINILFTNLIRFPPLTFHLPLAMARAIARLITWNESVRKEFPLQYFHLGTFHSIRESIKTSHIHHPISQPSHLISHPMPLTSTFTRISISKHPSPTPLPLPHHHLHPFLPSLLNVHIPIPKQKNPRIMPSSQMKLHEIR